MTISYSWLTWRLIYIEMSSGNNMNNFTHSTAQVSVRTTWWSDLSLQAISKHRVQYALLFGFSSVCFLGAYFSLIFFRFAFSVWVRETAWMTPLTPPPRGSVRTIWWSDLSLQAISKHRVQYALLFGFSSVCFTSRGFQSRHLKDSHPDPPKQKRKIILCICEIIVKKDAFLTPKIHYWIA